MMSQVKEWLPDSKSSPTWPKNLKNSLKDYIFFCSDGMPDSSDIGNQPLYFHQMIISKIFKA